MTGKLYEQNSMLRSCTATVEGCTEDKNEYICQAGTFDEAGKRAPGHQQIAGRTGSSRCVNYNDY